MGFQSKPAVAQLGAEEVGTSSLVLKLFSMSTGVRESIPGSRKKILHLPGSGCQPTVMLSVKKYFLTCTGNVQKDI